MIASIPYINLLNLSWRIKCLFLRNMETLSDDEKDSRKVKMFVTSCYFHWSHGFLKEIYIFALGEHVHLRL